MRTLMEGDFLDRKENILTFGNPGSGKTHLLVALGQELIRKGRRIHFTTCTLVTQVKIDIFLLDAILPGMNGADLAEELSKSQQSATTVFMSGLDAMAVWMAFGKPCQVLQKPFSSEQLICKLEATGPVASAT